MVDRNYVYGATLLTRDSSDPSLWEPPPAMRITLKMMDFQARYLMNAWKQYFLWLATWGVR